MKELRQIKKTVEKYFNFKDIGVKTRTRELVEARVVYMFLAAELTSYSYESIAHVINRDHSTVTHAINVIYDQWKSQPYYFRSQLTAIKTIHKIIADEEDIEDFFDMELILQKYKARVILQNKQIDGLIETLVKKDELIKKLQKYAPIL